MTRTVRDMRKPLSRSGTPASMDQGPIRITLIGGVGTGNIGNDTSMSVVMDRLRVLLPDVEFTIATTFPEGAAATFPDHVVPLRQNLGEYRALGSRRAIARAILTGEARRLRLVHRTLRESRLAIVTGTGIFDDFGEKPWNMPYALLLWTAMARLCGRPVHYVSVGAGPIVSRVNRALMIAAARLATTVSYRDPGSRDYMAEHGAARPDAGVLPDLVFGHPVPALAAAAPTRAGATIGIGVMDYGGWSKGSEGDAYEPYLELLTTLVEQLIERGHPIRFMVGQDCDLEVVHDLIDRVSPAVATQLTIPQIADFPALLEAAASTDLVVATRFHNVVAALMTGRPVVSLSYAPKNGELLKAVGLDGVDRAIEEADSQWALARIDDMVTGRLGLRPEATDEIRAWWHLVQDEILATVERAGIEPSSAGRHRVTPESTPRVEAPPRRLSTPSAPPTPTAQ